MHYRNFDLDEPALGMGNAAGDERSVHDLLSPREQEIARLVAVGYPNKTIAGILDISPWTVATHVRRIFNKLNVHGRPAMIARLALAGFRFSRGRPATTSDSKIAPASRDILDAPNPSRAAPSVG